MQLGTIAANYLVFLQVSKLLLNSIQFLKQRLLAQVKLGYELPHAPEKQSKLWKGGTWKSYRSSHKNRENIYWNKLIEVIKAEIQISVI